MNIFETNHPFFIHFPIALIVIAFVFEIAGMILKRPLYNQIANYLLGIGAVTYILAYFSGPDLGEKIKDASNAASQAFKSATDSHEESASTTLWIVLVLVVIKGIHMYFKDKYEALKYISLGVYFATIFTLLRTAYLGGIIVYKHSAELMKVLNP